MAAFILRHYILERKASLTETIIEQFFICTLHTRFGLKLFE